MIGLELEGGWKNKPERKIYEDCSVCIDDDDANFVGEINSQPFSDLKELKNWLFKNYPNRMNRTCGLHVHISLKNNLLYSKLMQKDFHDYLKEMLKDFIVKNKLNTEDKKNLIERVDGYNRFCRDNFYADEQVIKKSKETCRYTHINYCYALHGTIEFRVLCMFKSKQTAFKAIKVIIKCVNEYLRKANKEKEEKVIMNVLEQEVNDADDKIIIREMI
jgi:hypothetical protein